MPVWLVILALPPNNISFFRAGTLDMAPDFPGLAFHGTRLAPLSCDLSWGQGDASPLCESGYLRVAGREKVALLDVVPTGPGYLSAHSLPDTLFCRGSLFAR